MTRVISERPSSPSSSIVMTAGNLKFRTGDRSSSELCSAGGMFSFKLAFRVGVETGDDRGDETGSFLIVVLDDVEALRSSSSSSHGSGCIQEESMVIALTVGRGSFLPGKGRELDRGDGEEHAWSGPNPQAGRTSYFGCSWAIPFCFCNISATWPWARLS